MSEAAKDRAKGQYFFSAYNGTPWGIKIPRRDRDLGRFGSKLETEFEPLQRYNRYTEQRYRIISKLRYYQLSNEINARIYFHRAVEMRLAGQYFSFLSLAFCASKSFHHSFVELVDKFKEKLKIGAPLE